MLSTLPCPSATPDGSLTAAYTVENGWSDEEVFASKLKVGSDTPILNLEEIEHHIGSLDCGEGTMKLRFVDAVSARDATAACHDGLIITSHEGCNVEGERAVYKSVPPLPIYRLQANVAKSREDQLPRRRHRSPPQR